MSKELLIALLDDDHGINKKAYELLVEEYGDKFPWLEKVIDCAVDPHDSTGKDLRFWIEPSFMEN